MARGEENYEQEKDDGDTLVTNERDNEMEKNDNGINVLIKENPSGKDECEGKTSGGDAEGSNFVHANVETNAEAREGGSPNGEELNVHEIKVETDYLDLDDDDVETSMPPEEDCLSDSSLPIPIRPGKIPTAEKGSGDRRVLIPRTELRKSRILQRQPEVRLVKVEGFGRCEPWASLEPNPRPLLDLTTFTVSGKQALER